MTDATDAQVESASPEYELRLTGGGIAVERRISESEALQILSLVMGGGVGPAKKPAGSGGAGPPSGGGATPSTTVGEYLEEVGAKRNPDKIAAIGAFLSDHLGQQSFTREEVKAQFQHAGETPPANFSRDFGGALTNKWIAETTASEGEYFVTNTGRKAISDQFAGEVRKPRRAGARRRAQKKAAPAE